MTRAAIKHAEDALRTAMLEGDVATLDQLIDDDVLFISRVGETATKADGLHMFRTGDQKITRHVPSGLTIILHGDDLAVSTVVVDLGGTFQGKPFAGTFRYTRTWRRVREGAWRIIGGATVSVGGEAKRDGE